MKTIEKSEVEVKVNWKTLNTSFDNHELKNFVKNTFDLNAIEKIETNRTRAMFGNLKHTNETFLDRISNHSEQSKNTLIDMRNLLIELDTQTGNLAYELKYIIKNVVINN